MKLFENNTKNEDERIVLQRLKIFKEAYLVITFALFISMAVKLLYFDLSFSAYITEYILIPTGAVYILVRGYIEGERIQVKINKSSMFIIPLIYALIFTIFALIGKYRSHELMQDLGSSLIYLGIIFISIFVLTFIIVLISSKLFNKRSKKLEKKYDDE